MTLYGSEHRKRSEEPRTEVRLTLDLEYPLSFFNFFGYVQRVRRASNPNVSPWHADVLILGVLSELLQSVWSLLPANDSLPNFQRERRLVLEPLIAEKFHFDTLCTGKCIDFIVIESVVCVKNIQ